MKKILIIGISGAGKSTFAQQLHTLLNIPIIHLDKLFWKPGWVKEDQSSFEKKCLLLQAMISGLSTAITQTLWSFGLKAPTPFFISTFQDFYASGISSNDALDFTTRSGPTLQKDARRDLISIF